MLSLQLQFGWFVHFFGPQTTASRESLRRSSDQRHLVAVHLLLMHVCGKSHPTSDLLTVEALLVCEHVSAPGTQETLVEPMNEILGGSGLRCAIVIGLQQPSEQKFHTSVEIVSQSL